MIVARLGDWSDYACAAAPLLCAGGRAAAGAATDYAAAKKTEIINDATSSVRNSIVQAGRDVTPGVTASIEEGLESTREVATSAARAVTIAVIALGAVIAVSAGALVWASRKKQRRRRR